MRFFQLFIFGIFLIGLLSDLIKTPITLKSKPNILVIFTDDHGTLDVNVYGAQDLYTPNLDKLAKEGVRFSQFYATAPVCSPSRAGLLTGKFNYNAGLINNVQIPEKDPEFLTGLPTGEITMAETFREGGYNTALIGKWHLGHSPEKLPNGQGFDYFFGHQYGCIDNFSHFFHWDGPNRHDLFQNETEVYRNGEFFGDLMVEEVIKFTSEKKETPFFLYWAINMPHYPYQGKKKWLNYYKNLQTPRKEYAAFISTVDEMIGEVLDHLKATGELDNTIIVFQSDHGHSAEERAYYGGGFTGPYNGAKFSMLEGGIRVPAIIRYPSEVPAGEIRDQVANSIDWFPTLAELSGTDLPHIDEIDGKSLVPVLNDPQAPSLMMFYIGPPVTLIIPIPHGQLGKGSGNYWAIHLILKKNWNLGKMISFIW